MPRTRQAGLHYVHDGDAGIRRRKRGSGFTYLLPGGRELKNPRELQRIASLAIPPAYRDVWICRDPRGHLQATGRDARGRKQYRYHPDWRTRRDLDKFDRMAQFGAALPRLRHRLRRDLQQHGLTRPRVLALIVTLLDLTQVRVGNEEYARTNKSYGLTTLRNRHARFAHGDLVLQFRGKGGLEHEVTVHDHRLARLVHRCQELPGQHLFQYVDERGGRQRVGSADVNAYLHEVMGAEFTAKDFRTWRATLRALVLIAGTPLPPEKGRGGGESARKRAILDVVRAVASELRNTPTVCRKSYINPAVFVAWRAGLLHAGPGKSAPPAGRAAAERFTLQFLRRAARTA